MEILFGLNAKYTPFELFKKKTINLFHQKRMYKYILYMEMGGGGGGRWGEPHRKHLWRRRRRRRRHIIVISQFPTIRSIEFVVNIYNNE